MPSEEDTKPPSFLQRSRRVPALILQSFQGLGLRFAGVFHTAKVSILQGVRWSAWRSLQQLERLFWRHRTSRKAVQAGVKGSATTTGVVPADSSRTSAGASRAMEQILKTIEEAYEADIWSNIVDGLDEVAQACANGSLPKDTAEYNFTTDTARLVQLAAQCSKAAYADGPTAVLPAAGEPASSGIAIFDEATERSKASKDGMIKACMITANKAESCHSLIVAIRGTASLVDWIVNLDGELEPTGDFLPIPSLPPVGAHAGLLRVAKTMSPTICSKIIAWCQNQTHDPTSQPTDLIFTGHSAGGGVAALICAHIRHCRPDIQQHFPKIHCITFAAPPILTPFHITHQATPSDSNPHLTINLVNFGDIVPRAETNYIRSLLRLYEARAEHPSDETWDFDEVTAFNYGQIVIFQDISETDEQNVRGYNPSQGVWQNLAFGSVRAHPMDRYLEAVKVYMRQHDLEGVLTGALAN